MHDNRSVYFYPISAQAWKGGDGNRPLTHANTFSAYVPVASSRGFLFARKFCQTLCTWLTKGRCTRNLQTAVMKCTPNL